MNVIRKWAARHGIPLAAVEELEFSLRIGAIAALSKVSIDPDDGSSEARQQSKVRLEAARRGVRLFRNNVGALRDDRGVPVRYGLANDTKELNKVLKSSDLIGWTPRVITAADVGTKIAQFTTIEMKDEHWVFSANDHENAQLAWINLVLADGGVAKFCTGPDNF